MSFQVSNSSSLKINASSIQAQSSTQGIKNSDSTNQTLCHARVNEVFSKELEIVNNSGKLVKAIPIKQFLSQMVAELQAININPNHFQIVGGAVAYLIGEEKAAAYAEDNHISNPNLAEFNRLQDLDIAVDMVGHSDQILYKMAYCIVNALRKCGVPGNEYELFRTIFFRKKVIENEGMAILSIGNSNKFWLDFSFFTQRGRRNFSTRDLLATEIRGYLDGSKTELTWKGDPRGAYLAIEHRLKKILEITNIETVNHVGLPLLAMYLSKGYKPFNPYYFYPLAQKFISHHIEGNKKYIDTLQSVKNNHLNNDLDLYTKLAAACCRALISYSKPKLIEYIEAENFKGNSPECKFLSFLKSKKTELTTMSSTHILCLAEVMGLTPSFPILESMLRNFMETFEVNPADCMLLFGSQDSFPIYMAKKIAGKKWSSNLIDSSECFELLENNPHIKNPTVFFTTKFNWETQISLQKAFETWSKHRKNISNEAISKFLDKIFDTPCETLKSYFSLIFKENIDVCTWVQKLLEAKLFNEAISNVLPTQDPKAYKLVLDKLVSIGRFGEADRMMQKIQAQFPDVYERMAKNAKSQKALIEVFLEKQKTFNAKINEFIQAKNFEAVEMELMKLNEHFEVEPSSMETLLLNSGLKAFDKGEYDRLEFLIEHAVQHQVNPIILSDFLNGIIKSASAKNSDPTRAAWVLNYFISDKVSTFCNYELLIQLASQSFDKLPPTKLSNWLSFALSHYKTTQNFASTVNFVNLCLRTMNVNSKKINRSLIIQLSDFTIHLIQNKDVQALIHLSKELQGFKTKLILSSKILRSLGTITDNTEHLDQFLSNFGRLCPLPLDVEKPLVERSLIKLSTTNPEQAKKLFHEKNMFWINATADLLDLYHKLPGSSSLKFEIFLLLPVWKESDWKSMMSSSVDNPKQLFQLLMDEKSANFTHRKNAIKNCILGKKVSLNQAQRLLETCSTFLTDPHFITEYFKQFSELKYPVKITQEFFSQYANISSKEPIPSNLISQFKEMLSKLHEKDLQSPVNLIADLMKLESRIPENEKKEFFYHYFTLFPLTMSNIVNAKERAFLSGIINKYSIDTLSTASIILTDDAPVALDKAQMFLQKALDYPKNFVLDQSKIIELLNVLFVNSQFDSLKEILSHPQFQEWNKEIEIKKFVNQYLCKLMQTAQPVNVENGKEMLEYVLKNLNHCYFENWGFDGEIAEEFLNFSTKLSIKFNSLSKPVEKGSKVSYIDQCFERLLNQITLLSQHNSVSKAEGKNSKKHNGSTICTQMIQESPQSIQSKFMLLQLDKAINMYSDAIEHNKETKNLSEKIISQFDHFYTKFNQKEENKCSIFLFRRFTELFFSQKCVKHHDLQLRHMYFTLLTKYVTSGIFSNELKILLEISNLISQSPFFDNDSSLKVDLFPLINIVIEQNRAQVVTIKKMSPGKEALLKELKTYLRNYVYSVPPSDSKKFMLFTMEASKLLTSYRKSVAILNPIEYQSLLIYLDTAEARMFYYNNLSIVQLANKNLENKIFSDSIKQIIKDLPKEFLPKSYNYLITLFRTYLNTYGAVVTPAVIEAFDKTLNSYKIDDLTLQDIELLVVLFNQILKELIKSHNGEALISELFKIVLNWQMQPSRPALLHGVQTSQQELVLDISESNLFLFNAIVEEVLLLNSKEMTTLLLISLKQFTTPIIQKFKNKEQNLDFPWNRAFLRLVKMTCRINQLILPDSRATWEPVILNILKGIIVQFKESDSISIMCLLKSLQVSNNSQKNELKNLIIGFNHKQPNNDRYGKATRELQIGEIKTKELVLQDRFNVLSTEDKEYETEILKEIRKIVELDKQLSNLKLSPSEMISNYIIQLTSKEPKSDREAMDTLGWVSRIMEVCSCDNEVFASALDHVAHYMGVAIYKILEKDEASGMSCAKEISAFIPKILNHKNLPLCSLDNRHKKQGEKFLLTLINILINSIVSSEVLSVKNTQPWNFILSNFSLLNHQLDPTNQKLYSIVWFRFMDTVFSHSIPPLNIVAEWDICNLFNSFISKGALLQIDYSKVIGLANLVAGIESTDPRWIQTKIELFTVIFNYFLKNKNELEKYLTSKDKTDLEKEVIRRNIQDLAILYIFSSGPIKTEYCEIKKNLIATLTCFHDLKIINETNFKALQLYLKVFDDEHLNAACFLDLLNCIMRKFPKSEFKNASVHLLKFINLTLRNLDTKIGLNLTYTLPYYIQLYINHELTKAEFDELERIFDYALQAVKNEAKLLIDKLLKDKAKLLKDKAKLKNENGGEEEFSYMETMYPLTIAMLKIVKPMPITVENNCFFSSIFTKFITLKSGLAEDVDLLDFSLFDDYLKNAYEKWIDGFINPKAVATIFSVVEFIIKNNKNIRRNSVLGVMITDWLKLLNQMSTNVGFLKEGTLENLNTKKQLIELIDYWQRHS